MLVGVNVLALFKIGGRTTAPTERGDLYSTSYWEAEAFVIRAQSASTQTCRALYTPYLVDVCSVVLFEIQEDEYAMPPLRRVVHSRGRLALPYPRETTARTHRRWFVLRSRPDHTDDWAKARRRYKLHEIDWGRKGEVKRVHRFVLCVSFVSVPAALFPSSSSFL